MIHCQIPSISQPPNINTTVNELKKNLTFPLHFNSYATNLLHTVTHIYSLKLENEDTVGI